ncbi:hypothetical protein SAMN04487914_14815 [Arthrobacter sp. ok909]|nr:hypothetical protein SAMN04487914_14815 [Arthrobacter sp. ok909]
MEYMLFICSDSAAPAYVAAEDNIVEWGAEMEARGVARHGARGEVVVSDGPFAETRNGSPAMTSSLVPISTRQ